MKSIKQIGITLIALVITIIVLLILAGVSLNLISGSDGILEKASKAVNKTHTAQMQEEIELAMMDLKNTYYEEKFEKGTETRSFVDYAKEHLESADGVKTSNGFLKKSLENNNVTYYDFNHNVQATGTFDELIGSVTILGITTEGDVNTPPDKDDRDNNPGGGDNPSGSIFTYEIVDDTVSISGLTEDNLALTNIVIPEQIEDKTVVAIGANAFQGNTTLTSITMPDTVTSINNSAFSGCTSLSEIALSNNLQTIGNASFFGCSQLSEINLPDGLQTIGTTSFANTALNNITFPATLNSLGTFSFMGSQIESAIFEGENCTFETGIFQGTPNLSNVVLPSKLTTLGTQLFYGNTALTTIELPNTLTTIGAHAFRYCSTLTTLTIPASVKEIKVAAFSGCSNLILNVPSTVSTIDFGTLVTHSLTFQDVKLLYIPSKWKSSITSSGDEKNGAQNLSYT